MLNVLIIFKVYLVFYYRLSEAKILIKYNTIKIIDEKHMVF